MSHVISENFPLLLAVEECLKDLGMSVIILFLAGVCICVWGGKCKRARDRVQKLYSVCGLRLFLIS